MITGECDTVYDFTLIGTVDREIFAVKKFSLIAWVAKIIHVKNYFVLYLQCKIEARW